MVPFSRWHYQLQGYENFLTKQNGVEGTLYVIDYSKDGTQDNAWTREEIERLKNSGRNRVLSYLSVAEAEEVRFYYAGLPKDLKGRQVEAFPDNHTVNYWDMRWQQIILQYLDRILTQGFDGVYLDTIDVFERFKSRKTAAKEMVEWVIALASTARKGFPSFYVFVQNATCLPERENFSSLDDTRYEELLSRFWSAIDGVGLESTFYFGNKWEDNPYRSQKEVLRCLEGFKRRKKVMVGVEYVRSRRSQRNALQSLRKVGILGLVTDRHLKGEFMVFP